MLKWEIYKLNSIREQHSLIDDTINSISYKKIEDLVLYIKLKNKKDNFEFYIKFFNNDLENIKRVDFFHQDDLEKLNEIETLFVKDKILKSLKKYVNDKDSFSYLFYGIIYDQKSIEKLKNIINKER